MKKFNLIFGLFIFTLMISCKDINLSEDLVGNWMQVDVNNKQEVLLKFNKDNSGFKTVLTGELNSDKVTSSAIFFNWKVEKDVLKFNELDEIINTKLSFNSKGQLILEDYSELPFNKVE